MELEGWRVQQFLVLVGFQCCNFFSFQFCLYILTCPFCNLYFLDWNEVEGWLSGGWIVALNIWRWSGSFFVPAKCSVVACQVSPLISRLRHSQLCLINFAAKSKKEASKMACRSWNTMESCKEGKSGAWNRASEGWLHGWQSSLLSEAFVFCNYGFISFLCGLSSRPYYCWPMVIVIEDGWTKSSLSFVLLILSSFVILNAHFELN